MVVFILVIRIRILSFNKEIIKIKVLLINVFVNGEEVVWYDYIFLVYMVFDIVFNNFEYELD